MKAKKTATLALVKLCCRVLDDKKAEQVRVLDVSAQSSITDFLIVATATSTPHLRALRVELEKALDAAHQRIVGIETAEESGWTVIDAFDVMVHLFFAARRAHYGLENLWKDAAEIPLASLLATAKATKRRAAPRSRRRAAKASD
jgi:ribosome-associated protein